MSRLQLISCPVSDKNILSDKWYFPLNLAWLSSYLESKDIKVEVLDGVLLSTSEIVNRITAPIVGINFNIHSVESMEKIIGAAKRKGAFVVLGGQAATPLASQLLKNNKNIDVVVLGDGEDALLNIARNIHDKVPFYRETPNLAYRDGEKIVYSHQKQVDIRTLPLVDRSTGGLNIESYISRFYKTNTDPVPEGLRATNAYLKKGCPRRTNGGGCSFCARIDKGIRAKTAVQAYEEYSYLVEAFDINYIYDDSDSWIQYAWMSDLLKLYETCKPINARLRVYADVRDVNERTVELMKELNVDTVLIGVESGDERILSWNGKRMSRNMIINAAKLLGRAGIKVCDAYVLGMIGETRSSVNRTLSIASLMNDYCEKTISYWNMVLPLPGSQLWKAMMKIDTLRVKYSNEYKFNIEEVKKDYMENFCHLGKDGFDFLKHLINRLQTEQEIVPRKYIR